MHRLALLLLLAPTSALAWDDAEMCEPLMQMVAQAPDVFETLRGEETVLDGLVRDTQYASTAELPKAKSCTIGLYGGINQDMSLTCRYGTKSEKGSLKLLDRLAAATSSCVPEDWSSNRSDDRKTSEVVVQHQAPGGMDATSVTVERRRVDTKKYEVLIRVQAF